MQVSNAAKCVVMKLLLSVCDDIDLTACAIAEVVMAMRCSMC